MKNGQNLWHTLAKEEIFNLLETSGQGLTTKEGNKRLAEYGENITEPKIKSNWAKILFSQFQNPLIYILMISALITYVIHHSVDTWVILAVIIFNSLIGFIQEYKASRTIGFLKDLSISSSPIIRDGKTRKIKHNLLVPGDIIELEPGMRIPADLRLIEGHSLEIDQSIITGESLPVAKKAARMKIQKPLAERTNILYSGSLVAAGKGIGVIIATGLDTVLGQISRKIRTFSDTKTPLQIKMEQFGKILLAGIIIACLGIFIVGIAIGMDILEIFLTVVSLSVAAIPEGLPAVVTITLAVGMHHLGQKGALTRKLVAVETLGSANLIATDKTGTLTENKMFVAKIYAGTRIYRLGGEGYEPKGNFYLGNKIINPNNNPKLAAFLQSGILCSDAKLIRDNNDWKIIGDPTEGALVTAARKAGIEKNQFIKYFPQIGILPFSSRNSLMAILRKGKNYNIISAKGAPERILSLCRLNKKKREEIEKKMEEMAIEGLRVLAIAKKRTKAENISHYGWEKILDRMEFLGLAGIWDPPRSESKKAVQAAQKAGIRTIIITGDHPLTAFRIGQKVSIIPEKEIYLKGKNVICGEELSSMEGKELERILEKINIFARISPEHKLKLVQSFQKKGYVVGVTGDGVNDAPALKVADIGIAMGKEGTDVAREASDIVLTDDNFATIIEIIRKGRNILQNIRRATFYLLSTNMAEMLIIAMALIFSWPLPLLPGQILLINLLTDGTAGVALAFEPDHENQLKYPPRNLKEGIINLPILSRILIVGITISILTLLAYRSYLGGDLNQARTMAFIVLACTQIINIFNSRSFIKSIFQISPFSNKFVPISALLSIIGTLSVVQIPALASIFHFQPLGVSQWLFAFSLSLVIIAVVETDKRIRVVN